MEKNKKKGVTRKKRSISAITPLVVVSNTIIRIRLFGMVVFYLVLAGVAGCGGDELEVPVSIPTSGVATICIDESLRPFAEAEIKMFSAYYPDAHITPCYLPEKQVIERLLANEIQTAVICRDLHPAESDSIEASFAHVVRSFKLARDTITAVVNRENPINTISSRKLHGIMSGTVSDWREVSPSVERPSPILPILTRSSSIDRYFSNISPIPTETIYAFDTTTEVIEYVTENVSAIGMVGGSWVSRKGYSNKEVRILSCVADSGGKGNGDIILSRDVYAITHEPNTGLGSGFISFMASQKGQLILSKTGMTPYKPIDREIELQSSFRK